MKKRYFLKLWLCLFPALLMSCLDENGGNSREVTGYEEYVLTVASEKIQGLTFNGGNNYVTDVYAVKRDHADQWEAFGYIDGFTYEQGYEYQIRISQTDYLDYSMGNPAWSEYALLEVVSKEKKNSEGLPDNFIPDWYTEDSSK